MAWRRPGDKPLFEPMMVSLVPDLSLHPGSDAYYADFVYHRDFYADFYAGPRSNGQQTTFWP